MRNMVRMSQDLVALGIALQCPSTQRALESRARTLSSFSKCKRLVSVKFTQETSVATPIQSRSTRVISRLFQTLISKLRPIHRL